MPSIIYVFGLLFLSSMFLIFWMRWRMKASKGRFALSVVSSLLTCLLTGLSVMSSSIPLVLVSRVSQSLGHGPIDSGIPAGLVLILTLVAMFFIYRFGVLTVVTWDAPPRVSELNLSEKYLENSIAALSLEQVRLFVRRQNDPLASDAVANWMNKTSKPPTPAPAKELLRDMLVAAFGEIRIPDDGWRDDGQFWVGEILGLSSKDTMPIIVFINSMAPTKRDIELRVKKLDDRFGNLNGYRLFSVYLSKRGQDTELKNLVVSGTSISVLSSRDMILKGLDLRNYAREIIDLFERTPVGGTTATLGKSYVDPSISVSGDNQLAENLSENLDQWLSESTNEHIAITGEYGQGKSTTLLKFCYDWAKNFIDTGATGERIPLLIELRGQNPSETDPLGFLSTWCARYRLLPQQVLNLIKSGDAVVIFEGFDELRNSGRAFYRHQHFNALWRFAYPGTKIIFTGRPNFFLDQGEANRTLRSHETRKLGGDAFTSVWKLKKLNSPQIVEACRAYKPSVRDGIEGAIETSPDFLDIVSRPSMLPVVATIWDDIQEFQKEGTTLTGAVLIEKYIQAVFSRKEAELENDRIKHDAPSGSKYLILPKEVRELLTICVAWRMVGLKSKNTISRPEIVEMVREIYDTFIVVSKSEGVSPPVAAGIIEFEKRFEDESPAEKIEAIAAEICSAGLLVPDAAGGASNLRFPHKQFFEFLIAKGVAIKSHPQQFLASKLLDRSSSESSLLLRLGAEPNSVVYLAECIGDNIKQFVTPFRRYLLQFAIIQQLAAHKLIRTVEAVFPRLSNSIFGIDIQFDYVPDQEAREMYTKYGNMERMSLRLIGLAAPMALIFLLTTFGAGIVSIYDHGGSIYHLSLIAMSTLLGGSLSLSWREMDHFGVIFQFLRVHWDGTGVSPKTRTKELLLARSSLAKGRVDYGAAIERTTDYDQFLYPAREFGIELETRKFMNTNSN